MSDQLFNEKQKYCDVKFMCLDSSDASGKSSVGAHKSILSMASDVFEAMFHGPLAKKAKLDEEAENCVEIIDIDIKIFKMMLSFMYGLEVKIENAKQGCEFYYAVHKYNVKDGIKFASVSLSKKFIPGNAIYIYETTLPYDDKKLKEVFFNMLSQKANEIIAHKSFLNASLTTVETIFKLDKLNIVSEFELVNALKRYIDAKSETDKEIAVKIRPALQSIRFLTLSAEMLSKSVYNAKLLTSEEIVNIIACLPPEKDLARMPKGFSQSTAKRSFYQKDMMIRVLTEVFSSKTCNYCAPYSRASNHALWNCIHDKTNTNKEVIRAVYQKYNHVWLMEYINADVITLHKAYKEMGYIA